MFSETDPFTGTDLDACVLKDGSIAAWAQEIITTLSSYTEYSPSKLGVHLLTQAALQGAGRKIGNVEMYAEGRFFTITADHVPGTPTTIADRQQQQTSLYTSLVGELPSPRRSENTGWGAGLGDTLARSARNRQRFQALWNGDISGYRSKSEADFTLVLYLLYWTNDDLAQTKRLF